MSSLLRGRPNPDAVASVNRHAATKRAGKALDRRLEQLEAEHAAFTRSLIAVEKAVRWLPETQRARARRRLRDLGHERQLDPFQDLHAVLEDAA
jgi:hypothetical protein